MKTFEFLKFDETPKEKNYVGVATIRANLQSSEFGNVVLILRYKINKAKNGGYFPQSPSIKLDSDPGESAYCEGHQFDSVFLNKEVEALIRTNIKKFLNVDTKAVTTNVQNGTNGQSEDDNLPF